MTTGIKVTGDFDFLNGYFDVRQRQRKLIFAGCDEWEAAPSTSASPGPPGVDEAA